MKDRSKLAPPDCDAATLRSVVDNLREVVFQTDANGMWTFLNPAWEELTGFSVAESLGTLFLDYVHPDDRETNQKKFEPLIQRKKDVCYHDVRYLTKDGSCRWVEVHARLTLNAAGDIIGTSGTLYNLTERRRIHDELHEARERLGTVLASSPAILFTGVPDLNGGYATTFISDNVRSILGHAPEAYLQDPTFWLGTIHPDDRGMAQRSFQELAASSTTTVRFRSRHADGSFRWTRTDVKLVEDSSGKPGRAFGCVVDETSTRAMQDDLQRHTAMLEAVTSAAQHFLDGCWEHKIDRVLEQFGRASECSRVYVFEHLVGTDGARCARQRYEWSAEGIEPQIGNPELQMFRFAGETEAWAASLASGAVVHGTVSMMPLELQRVLQAQSIRSIALAPIFGGPNCWGFIGFDDCLTDRRWSAGEVKALEAAAGILGAAIRREETERTLRYNEALLRTMADCSPLGFYVIDGCADRVLYGNDRFCDIWGIPDLKGHLRGSNIRNADVVARCSPAAKTAPSFANATHPDRRNSTSAEEEQIELRDGRTIRQLSVPVCNATDECFGRLYLFEDATARVQADKVLRDSRDELDARVRERTNELEALNSALRNEIAIRRQAEHDLSTREAHFRSLIENTHDVLLLLEASGTIKSASASVTRVLHLLPEQVAGAPALSFVHPEDVGIAAAALQRSLTTPGTGDSVTFRVLTGEQQPRWIEGVSNNQIDNPAVGGLIVTLRDITERRLLEDQFRQAQKMEAIGRLAGGVAHDFNNLLTVINGYGELLTRRLDPASPLQKNVTQIRRAGDRAASLVQQLLAFSRKQVIEPTTFDIQAAVGDLAPMLRRLIGEDIELIVTCRSAVPLNVTMDRSQFDQIVMNLTVNARDAMPSGGTLSIETAEHRNKRSLECSKCTVDRGGYVMLMVSDTGLGIPEDIRSRIFEPFFTTKEVGKGTGLGLSMVYGAVQQAGGHVCLQSEVGKGSTFRICVPYANAAAGSATEGLQRAEPAPVSGTVLVVEDEELVRIMIRDTLADAGYSVLEARNGDQAVELMQREPSNVDLLLTDVVLPRLNGLQVAARARTLRPDIKVLFVSGYPRQELPPDCAFLSKPFAPDEIVREVGRLMRQPTVTTAAAAVN